MIAAYYETGPGKDLRSGEAARAVIEVVFAEHLSRPSLDVRPGQLQIAADSWRSKSTAARAVAFFRPLAAWGLKRELMVKGFDDLEMPALAQDGEEIGQHVLSREESWERCSAPLARAGMTAQRGSCCLRRPDAKRSSGRFGPRLISKGGPGRYLRRDGKIRERLHAADVGRRLITSSLYHDKPGRYWRGLGRARRLISSSSEGAESKLTNWPRWSAQLEKKIGVASVTPHALRRTAATMAGDLGCAPHVISAMLGHRVIGGALIAGYNQSRFTREVADALQQVGDLLTSIEFRQDNVVALNGARRGRFLGS